MTLLWGNSVKWWALTTQMLAVCIQRERCHRWNMLSLTKFLQLMTVLSKIMCNSGRSALGQAGRKHLRSRQSLVTLIGGSSSPPPPDPWGWLMFLLPTQHLSSLWGWGLTTQVLASRLLPLAALNSLEGMRSEQWQECQLELHKILPTRWLHCNSEEGIRTPL